LLLNRRVGIPHAELEHGVVVFVLQTRHKCF
jgi:hypothetical protein